MTKKLFILNIFSFLKILIFDLSNNNNFRKIRLQLKKKLPSTQKKIWFQHRKKYASNFRKIRHQLQKKNPL